MTEGVLPSRDPAVDTSLDAYRAAGVRFPIDDFGSEYSSLAYLQRLGVEFPKIDRIFIHAMGAASDGLALCEAIIEMARKMGITVIAEGVETDLHNSLLRAAGCDYAQGFLHARPMHLDGLIAAIAARTEIGLDKPGVSPIVLGMDTRVPFPRLPTASGCCTWAPHLAAGRELDGGRMPLAIGAALTSHGVQPSREGLA